MIYKVLQSNSLKYVNKISFNYTQHHVSFIDFSHNVFIKNQQQIKTDT